MSDEKERDSKLRAKILEMIKKVDLPTLIRIGRILGIPIHKEP
jgi:hypothetical protein